MLELVASEAALVLCLARPEALDGLPAPAEAFPARVAPDELLLLAPAGSAAELLAGASAFLAQADAGALAVDVSDGWAVWTISGPGAAVAFARLSAIPWPERRPAFVQGAIAHVAGKALACDDRVHLLVASTLRDHLHERIEEACADLGLRAAGSAPLGIPGGVSAVQVPAGGSAP